MLEIKFLKKKLSNKVPLCVYAWLKYLDESQSHFGP